MPYKLPLFVNFPKNQTVLYQTKNDNFVEGGLNEKEYSQRERDGESRQRTGKRISAEVVARGHGVTRVTLYNWKSKYSGMDVNQVRRLKELEEENRKLKQMYADLALDNRILRDVIKKNSRARDKEKDSSRAC